MKKYIILALYIILAIIMLISCNDINEPNDNENDPIYQDETNNTNYDQNKNDYTYPNDIFAHCNCPATSAQIDPLTFEEIFLLSTDVVVAQFVGYRRMGRFTEELEFRVSERILGDAADTIFVYFVHRDVLFYPGIAEPNIELFAHQFEEGVNYLLPLFRNMSVVTNRHDDAYSFIAGNCILINLDNPDQIMVRSENILFHSTELDFSSRGLSGMEVLSYVQQAINDDLEFHAEQEGVNENAHSPIVIRSNDVSEIVNGSPTIVEIEANQLVSTIDNCLFSHNIYIVTVTRSLKGSFELGYVFDILVPLNSMSLEGRYIVAIDSNSNRLTSRGYYSYPLTSRNSVFPMEYEQQIGEILGIR